MPETERDWIEGNDARTQYERMREDTPTENPEVEARRLAERLRKVIVHGRVRSDSERHDLERAAQAVALLSKVEQRAEDYREALERLPYKLGRNAASDVRLAEALDVIDAALRSDGKAE